MTARCQHCGAEIVGADAAELVGALGDHYSECPRLPRVGMAPTQLERRRGVGAR